MQVFDARVRVQKESVCVWSLNAAVLIWAVYWDPCWLILCDEGSDRAECWCPPHPPSTDKLQFPDSTCSSWFQFSPSLVSFLTAFMSKGDSRQSEQRHTSRRRHFITVEVLWGGNITKGQSPTPDRETVIPTHYQLLQVETLWFLFLILNNRYCLILETLYNK